MLSDVYAGKLLTSSETTCLAVAMAHYEHNNTSQVKKEQRCGGEDKRRPVHLDFLDGKLGFFHVTVRNSLQSKYVVAAARKAGAAAEAGECEKDERHDEEVRG